MLLTRNVGRRPSESETDTHRKDAIPYVRTRSPLIAITLVNETWYSVRMFPKSGVKTGPTTPTAIAPSRSEAYAAFLRNWDLPQGK